MISLTSTKITDFITNKSPTNDKVTSVAFNINIIKNFLKAYEQTVNNGYYTKIITILGAENRGKSTFLNALITTLTGSILAPFKSADTRQRMNERLSSSILYGKTLGLEGFILPGSDRVNYLFIDVQGLQGIDSIADPILIQYCYSISDLVIINSEADLNVQTLFMFQHITINIESFIKASKNNKPYGIFRIFNSRLRNNSEVNASYKTMIEPREDAYVLIRKYIKDIFQWNGNPCIWSLHPDQIVLDSFRKDQDINKFIESVTNYGQSCKELSNIILGLPARNINLYDLLINTAEEINKEFSKIFINSSLIGIDEKMRSWFDDLHKNGRYSELLEQLECKDCTSSTYALFKDRERKIAECENEISNLFCNNHNLERGLELLKERIYPHFKIAKSSLECHIKATSQNIRESIRTAFENEILSDINSTWINHSRYRKVVEESAGNIAWEIKKQIIDNFNTQYQKINEKFLGYRDKFLNNIKNILDQFRVEIISEKKECINRLNDFADKFEVAFDEAVDLCLNRIQLKYKLIIDSDLANRANKCIIDKELKEQKSERISTDLKTYLIVTPKNFKLIYDDEIDIIESGLTYEQDVDISQMSNNLDQLMNELRNSYLAQKNKFEGNRKKSMVRLLSEINTKTYEERCDAFEKLKHNDLYMFNFSVETDAFKLFRSLDGNLMIYTNEQFLQKFCSKVRILYKVYRQSIDELERLFAKNEIYRVWAYDYLEKKYK